MNSDSSLYLDEPYTESQGSDGLSIALIGPDEERRKAAASTLAECQGGVIREFSTYPPSLDDVPKLLEQHHDVIIIDLDSRPEYALELVESICANGAATVMVYSMKFDSDLLVRCMRAGAREFLTLPFTQSTVAEALVRASARRPAPRPAKKAGGKLMAFLGAKGGDGVTTLACNFAVSMAQESGQSTLLIDMDLPLGDAALNLGVVAEYSTINALQNAARLDSAFLSKLLVKHSSGVSVLAAPGKFPQFDASHEAIDKLLTVARQDFDNVVVDMGSRLDLMGTSLFKEGSTVYLVIQAGIAGLRNSNRLISQYFATDVPKLEIVLNRYQSRSQGVGEDQITKALTRPAQWKIPNDYAAVRRMQHTAVPLALEDSPISRLIRQMTRAACGLPALPEKGTAEKASGFSLKHLGRSFSAKISAPEPEEAPAIAQPESAPIRPILEKAAAAPGAAQPETNVEVPVKSGSTPPTETQPAAVEPVRPAETTNQTDLADAEPMEAPGDSAPSQKNESETRIYRGATYEKGTDGKWHLQKTAASALPASAEPASVEQASAEPASVDAATAEKYVEVEPVQQETPAIAWSTPAPISYGSALSATQLNAMASIPGAFVYTPAEGEVLAVGMHTLSVVFTPEDTATYTTAQAAVSLTVSKATPVITWTTPAPIAYGAELSATQLNATASVPGTFVYTPAAGVAPTAGVQTLLVTFTPTDIENYATEQATVSLTITKATPVITWTTPAPIAYGAELSATQLNATASVPGTFVYTPAAGVAPTAGVQTLLVTFTPTDIENYATEQATVSLTITKATPAVAWPAPDPIAYGVALSAAQLNATALVQGKFNYLPGIGAILAAGRHSLTLTFIPTDSANYTAAYATVLLTITKATPVITWATPASIAYGAALSAAQLNATASVPGQFVYTPAAGEVLTAGVQSLSAVFTPTDAANYTAAEATVPLTVTKATPIVTWSKPQAISYGTALSATQLNATASVPGTFVYIPAAGAVLTAGVQPLSATFTPADAANYSEAQGAVWLTISKATPIIIWPAPAPILSGDALSAAQLNATALVPGTFVYTPAAGVLLPAGTHTLSVTFTPTAITNYTVVRATVPLTVTEAAPAIPPPAPAQAETPLPLPTPAPEMPLAETPVKPPAEPAKPLIEPAKPLVEPVQQAPAEAPAAPPAKAAAEPPAESPAKPPVETPAKALVKVPPPRFAIEAGSGLDLMGTAVFPDGTTIYLVMQPGSGGPQDSKRLVSQFLAGGDLKPEIVINRYEPRPLGAGEDQESQALTKPASSPITRLIGQMAQPVSEPPAPPEKKKGFSLRGLRRSLWAKVSPTDQEQELTQLGLAPEQEDADSTQPAAPADKSVDAPHAEALPMSGTQAPSAPKPATDPADVKRAATPASAPYKQVEPETRTYQGATYVKGTDGKWHLQQLPTSFVKKETLAAVSPVPSPIAATAVPITTERSPSFQPEPVKAVPAQAMTPAPEAEPAPAHTPPEAPAKAAKPPETPVAMAPVKPPVEATAKASVKAAIKPPVKAPAKATVKAAPVQAMKPAFEAEPEPEKTPAEAPAETTPAQAMKPAFEAEPEPDKTPAEAPAETAPAQVIEPAFEAEPEPDKTPAEAPAEAVPAQVIEPAFEAEPEPEKTPAEAPAEVAAKPPVKAIKKPAKKATAKPPVKAANKPAKNASAKAVAKPARKPAKKVMAKPPVKTAKKPAKKASSKAPANPAKKSVKKVMAKPPVKATHKPARKSLAKSSVKAARKPVKKVLVKASAKAPAKTSKKASAKVQARHSAPAKKKLTPTARAKQAKAAKPKIRKPAPKPAKKR